MQTTEITEITETTEIIETTDITETTEITEIIETTDITETTETTEITEKTCSCVCSWLPMMMTQVWGVYTNDDHELWGSYWLWGS